MKICITGMAGMIGFHLAIKLAKSGHEIVGFDNFNDYYDVELKRERARILEHGYGIYVESADVRDEYIDEFIFGCDAVVHLAAQVAPRHSLVFPQLYIDNNITGTQHLIDVCKKVGVENVVYASTSCVMHGQPLPWVETDNPGHQNNPYGWSKRANECQFMHSTIKKTTGLRFFTAYGEYGRPDTAIFMFTKSILAGEEISVFNYGDMWRDWTYVGDIVAGVEIALNYSKTRDSSHEIYNIGYGESVNLMDFVAAIEESTGCAAILNPVEAHPADVPKTWSNTDKLKALGYRPTTQIKDGVNTFVAWYRSFYGV